MSENTSGYGPPLKTWRFWQGMVHEEQCLTGDVGVVRSVSLSPDGSRLVSASSDKTVRIWNGKTGQEEHCLKGHRGTVYSVSWSPDGSRLVSASGDKTVRIWNCELQWGDHPIQPALKWTD